MNHPFLNTPSMVNKMKAVIWTKYGPPEVLHYKEIEKPVPRDNEVLIKVQATSLTTGDCELRSFRFPVWIGVPLRFVIGITKPRKFIMGMYFSGEIESAGKKVTLFKKGDKIYGTSGLRLGTNAEYMCLPEESEIALKPQNLSFEEAAAVPIGGLNALHFIRKANIKSGEKMLINGAGGSIGTFAVQLAKLQGAEVTAVDHSEKLSMLSSIGADHVIDYNLEDFTNSKESYDIIFDVVGKSSYSRCLRSLRKNGRYILGNPRMRQMIRSFFSKRKDGKKIIFEFAAEKAKDLNYLSELLEAGKIKPVIDRIYLLEETVEAHRYVENGQKKGNVVITIKSEN